MRPLVAYYLVVGNSVKVTHEGRRVTRDITAKWSLGGLDTLEARAQVLQEVRERLGVTNWDEPKIELSLGGLVPPDMQPENRAEMMVALASFRVQCIVSIPRLGPLAKDVGPCMELECRLAEDLASDDLGYVDGNDIDGALYRIFCYGKRKDRLIERVEAIVKDVDLAEVRIEHRSRS